MIPAELYERGLVVKTVEDLIKILRLLPGGMRVESGFLSGCTVEIFETKLEPAEEFVEIH
jgi:hypothetical protein